MTPAHAARSLQQVSSASPSGSFTDHGGTSADGRHVVFLSSKQLDPADTDSQIDVFDSFNGVATLVSIGPSGGNGPHAASFDHVSQDGSTVIFETDEGLVPIDTDGSRDVYARAAGTTTLISRGASSSAAYDAFYEGASADATKVFFGTNEPLVAADTDSYFDTYASAGGTATLMTTGPAGGNGAFAAEFAGASTDGSRMFFHSAEPLVPADTDGQVDLYERSGGTTTLASIGPAGGNGSFPATFAGCSADGSKVFFTTYEALVSADLGGIDVYRRASGTTAIMTSPAHSGLEEYAGNSANGDHVYYETRAKENPADFDSYIDVYDSNGGSISLVSYGGRDMQGASNTYFAGASQDGSHIFIRTDEPLLAGDGDNTQDIFEVTGGTTTLASVGPAGGHASVSAMFAGLSQDGSRLVFETYESLVSGDTDSRIDVYERTGGTTALLSSGAAGGNGAVDARFRGMTPDAGRILLRTGEPLVAGDSDAASDLYASSVPGRVVIVKDALPSDSQDFTFTIGGGLSLGLQAPPGQTTFDLDDDSDPTLSNTQTFDEVAAGSGYSVTEGATPGWDLTGATCDNGSPVTDIRVDAGQTTTCTFTNRKRGSIVVVKDAQPNAPRDFYFHAGGGLSPTSFQLDDDSDPTLSNTRTFSDVVPGSGYTLSEVLSGGWQQTSATCDNGSPVTNISVAAGETVTCTFVNTNAGEIVVVADSQPNDAQDFSYTTGGGLSPSSFQLDDDADGTLENTHTFTGVNPGGYSVTQGSTPAGWDLASATCSDGSPVSNIDVGPGETVTCTFVNRKRGTLVVVEDSQPDDPQDFSFTAGGGLSPTSFLLDDHSNPMLPNTQTFSNIAARNGYSISEAAVSGWFQASASCSNGSPVSNIDIPPGQTVTCTFVNTKLARITVVKDAQPNDAQDFAFTTTGLSPGSFSLDDDSSAPLSNTTEFSNLTPGSGYAVAETPVAEWDPSATCSDGSPVTNITLSAGEQITCTFVNRKRGSITIVKDTQPNDAEDFSFTTGGGLSPSAFQLDDDSNSTLSNTRTFSNLASGAGYSVAETAMSGWVPSSTCSDGSPVTNIDVAPGENVTCTFVNRRTGTIVAVKDAQPNAPYDFFFTAGGGLSPSSFQLDDDSDPTLSNSQTFTNVAPGAGYSLAESPAGGWDQQGANCNDGSPVSNINVSSSETVTCTFTNRKRGTIVVVEDAQPDDPQDFSFTAGGGLSPTSFQLDDDSDPALSNTRTFPDLVPGSGYTLAQTVPGGWDQTSATCDNGSTLGNITVAAGQTVTCTVTNRKRGTIVVVEDSQPDDPQNFTFAAGGGLSPTSFQLDDDSDPALSNTQTFSDVVPGVGYSVDETVPGGWNQVSADCSDGSAPASIAVSAGETVTCTFVNTKLAQLTVVKDAQPNDAQDFSFTTSGGLSPDTFQLDDDSNTALSNTQQFSSVTPGVYSVNEGSVAGWDVTGASCDDGSPTFAIDLGPGDDVTCTFTNRKDGNLIVVQSSNPNDPQDFSFSAGGGLSPSSFVLDDDSDPELSNTHGFTGIAAGTYSLDQTVPTGWSLTSATCDDGSPVAAIAVAAGETVTCTFVDTKEPPGTIVAVKDAQPNHAQDFSFLAGGGLSPASFALDDDSDGTLSNTRTFADVEAGTGYSLSETVPSGWDQGSATCDDGSPPANIDLGPGETVTCTFVNRQRGSIVVVKDALPNDAQDFSFIAGGGLSPSSFQLDDDADSGLSNTRTFGNVVPQAGYSVSENIPVGWGQDSASCSDGSSPANIDVGLGETVTCTFVNYRAYARPKGASPYRAALVPAYSACDSPNSNHGPPLASESCKPPVAISNHVTSGTPDANGRTSNLTGFLAAHVITGNPGTPADEADVELDVSLTDIRDKSDLSDYTGGLSAVLTVRATDRLSGPATNEPATSVEFPFSVAVPCTTTESTTTGSTCVINTTADAVLPGAAVEAKRAVWHLTGVEVYDGGADGDPLTAGNTLFAQQGLFVP